MRNNIFEIDNNSILYPVSNMVIVLNYVENTQRIFKRHTNLVSCIGTFYPISLFNVSVAS